MPKQIPAFLVYKLLKFPISSKTGYVMARVYVATGIIRRNNRISKVVEGC
jgi:hypothetical protein